MRNNKLCFGIVVGCLALSSSLFWLWMLGRDGTIYRENGPMENFQVACLGFGVVLLVRMMVRAAVPEERVLFFGFVLLFATLAILELDFRQLHSQRLNFWLRGARRNSALVLFWVTGAVLFWRNRQVVWRLFIGWRREPAAVLLIIAGCCWTCAGLVDKLKPFWSRTSNFMAEELIESNAVLFMLISVLLAARSQKRMQAAAAEDMSLEEEVGGERLKAKG